VKITFWGDSLTAGQPGSSYFDKLTQRLPEHTLVNNGKGGDTVVSLHKRMLRTAPLDPVDMAFLWIGTNDVFVKLSYSFRVLAFLRSMPASQNKAEFKAHYQSLLSMLSQNADAVAAVPPILIGEDLENRWNQQLAELARLIEELVSHYHNVTYLDLRAAFTSRLVQKQSTPYLPVSASQIAVDSLSLKTDDQIDQAAGERGLHFTLDGVHLNSVGADFVASQFIDVITSR
jgi:lysophospholipase L1-like esterase